MVKKALVCGAGGFIGSYLVKRLKSEGYWVRGVDIKQPDFSKTEADDFILGDLRDENVCKFVTTDGDVVFDEVYQLAADFGGMGFIESHEIDCLQNNVRINLNMLEAASQADIPRYFYSSSVCIYRDMAIGEDELTEEQAYPAMPDNEYGWEKLYSERAALAYAKNRGMEVRIARFQNCFGPESGWNDGREKAPAAICRKVAYADSEIEVWGDGTAVRSYIFVDDLVDGIRKLMDSDIKVPTNIGNPEYISVDELAKTIIDISGKKLKIKYVPGTVGVLSRNFSNKKIESTGWKAKHTTRQGLEKLYPWILEQTKK